MHKITFSEAATIVQMIKLTDVNQHFTYSFSDFFRFPIIKMMLDFLETSLVF